MSDKPTEAIKLELVINLDRLVSGAYTGCDGYDDEGSPLPGPTTFEEIVAALAAQELLKQLAFEDRRDLRQRIQTLRDEEIRKHVEPMVTAAITQPVQKTNQWGVPQGEPQELRDLIVDQAKEAVTAKRDRYGDKTRLIDNVIKDEVNNAFKYELKTVVDEAKAEARKLVQAKAAEVIAESIERLRDTK